MQTTEENSFDDVLMDPEKFYSDPADVSADARWTDLEAQKILAAWKANEEALMRAATEGLTGGEQQQLDDVAKELKQATRT